MKSITSKTIDSTPPLHPELVKAHAEAIQTFGLNPAPEPTIPVYEWHDYIPAAPVKRVADVRKQPQMRAVKISNTEFRPTTAQNIHRLVKALYLNYAFTDVPIGELMRMKLMESPLTEDAAIIPIIYGTNKSAPPIHPAIRFLMVNYGPKNAGPIRFRVLTTTKERSFAGGPDYYHFILVERMPDCDLHEAYVQVEKMTEEVVSLRPGPRDATPD